MKNKFDIFFKKSKDDIFKQMSLSGFQKKEIHKAIKTAVDFSLSKKVILKGGTYVGNRG